MSSNGRFWFFLVAATVVVVLLIGGSGDEGPPLDPRSVSPDGGRGLVETLERLGADVQLDSAVPQPSSGSAILLQDRLTIADRNELRAWVRDGGVLVVADTFSALAADRAGSFDRDSDRTTVINRGQCSIAALSDVETLRVTSNRVQSTGNESCFGTGNAAFVVATAEGRGTIVTVADPNVFTNRYLDDEDGAVLAVALLGPNSQTSEITFLSPSLVDFGDEGLGDIVPTRVVNAILQLLAAFLIYAIYRGRRLGGVVAEPVPVRIEGSEIVLKAGLLSERSKDPAAAAAILRSDVIGRAQHALSMPLASDAIAVAERVAARTGVPVHEVTATLTQPVTTETELVQVAHALASLDDQLFGQAAPISTPSTLNESALQ